MGAHPIVAVDTDEGRLEQAQRLGATHCLRGDDPDLAASVHSITDGGAEHAFEAIGIQSTLELLPSLIGRGGQAVIVGMPAEGTRVALDPFDLADQGKRVLGCNYGSTVPQLDFPRLAALYLHERLPIDLLIGRRAPLSDADRALADLRTATGLRTILEPKTA